jgi:hypothetical protein
MKTRTTLLIALALLTGCNAQTTYQVGNIRYETAHMPSWFGSTVTGTNHCQVPYEVDEAGNCLADHVTYAYASGLFTSFFGTALTAGAIAYAGHEIGAGAAKSGTSNSNSVQANQSVAQPGPWHGGYRH